jgi:uncharacterized FlaG/YvyC family protein
MKHIRKIFESGKSEIEEDVWDIFNEYLYESPEDIPTGTEYSGEIVNSDGGVLVIIYGSESNNVITSIPEMDEMIKSMDKHTKFVRKMRSLCYRLKSWGYEFSFRCDFESDEYTIKVFEKEAELNLEDAFKNRNLYQDIMKRVLKKNYGIGFKSSMYNQGSSGYYGSRSYHVIYLSTPIDTNNPLFKDLRELKIKSGLSGSKIENNIFNSVIPYHNYGTNPNKWISIKLEY